MEKRPTPKAYTVDDVANMLHVGADKLIKLLVFTADGEPVVALVRGDHELNEPKLRALLKCTELVKASEEVYTQVNGLPRGICRTAGAERTQSESKNFRRQLRQRHSQRRGRRAMRWTYTSSTSIRRAILPWTLTAT